MSTSRAGNAAPLLDGAQLVVLRAGRSDWLIWELAEAVVARSNPAMARVRFKRAK